MMMAQGCMCTARKNMDPGWNVQVLQRRSTVEKSVNVTVRHTGPAAARIDVFLQHVF